ncbi:MAG: hypothetical protein Kow00109_19620 [Acidobacteriota bacterium]
MMVTEKDTRLALQSLEELENLEEIVSRVVPSPGDVPSLVGVEVYGETMPLNGIIGGDHIIYVDFKKRYNLPARVEKARRKGREDLAEKLESLHLRAGIVVADVAGHRLTDAVLALMLHQAFLLGAMYELDFFGEITTRLFENLNSRFFASSTVSKFLTMIYGEIWEDGKFRFISAGHPNPVVFSRFYDRFVDISPEMLTTFPPLGTMPSYDDIDRKDERPPLGFKDRYEVNEITLMGAGDILILYTDGLSEHSADHTPYFPQRLEEVLRSNKDGSSREIYQAIRDDLLAFGPITDDVTFVVIKRH